MLAELLASAQQSSRAVALPDIISSLAGSCQKAAESAKLSDQPSHKRSEQPSVQEHFGDTNAMVRILQILKLWRAENFLGSVEHR